MSSGNRSNWGRKQWGGRGRGGFGGRDRGFRGGNRPFRGHNFGGNRGFRGGRQNDYGGRGGYQNWNRTPNDMPTKRLTEQEIGVTEYVSKHEGFQGIIKSRYSDFQVAEINLKGEIAKLTDTKVPEPPVDDDVLEDEDLLLNKYNVELLPMEVWDRINKLAIADAKAGEKVEVDVEGMTKEQRTKIHDAVKKAFGESIVGSTVSVDGKKTVRFERFRKGVRIDNRVKWVWGGEHVHFILHKENCDTMDAAQRIAERLRMNLRPSFLGYAGTKDRRAKTSQWLSARKLDPRRLSQAARDLRDIHIGNFTFSDTHLKLGMLKGNRFRIALRNVTATDDTVDAACQLLRDNGFINYYGLQRFGSRADSPTYEIGKSMLKGELKEAINAILRPRPGPLEHALEQYVTHGPAAAAAAGARHYHTIEMRLLRALAAQPNDLLGALNKLARNTRLLYIHSYQSVVWNRAVSERVRRFGLQPAPGDLVPLTDVDDDIDEDSDEENMDTEEKDGDDIQDTDKTQDNGDSRNCDKTEPESKEKEPETKENEPEAKENEPEAKEKEPETKEKEPEKKTKLEKVPVKFPVKILTQEDVDSGQYSIFDIIMPLPGHFIDYPPNMLDYYEELLKKDGLTLGLRNKIKSLSMSGAYRRLVTRPIDMSWAVARYDKPADDLILSDLDDLNGVQLKNNPEGQYKALLLTMSLPASCYATMALRELLRTDTSAHSQALQNNYHKDQTEGKDAEKRKMVSEEGNAKRAKEGE